MDETHYALVTDYNISNNSLICKGAVKASSESLTHAVVYESSPETQAIIHVHNNHLWKKYFDQVPTTKENVAYGTPEMGREVVRLFRETTVAEMRMIVMAGHEDGIIGFGKTLEEAGNVFLSRL